MSIIESYAFNYYPYENSVTFLPNMNQKRYTHCSLIHNNKLFVINNYVIIYIFIFYLRF